MITYLAKIDVSKHFILNFIFNILFDLQIAELLGYFINLQFIYLFNLTNFIFFINNL